MTCARPLRLEALHQFRRLGIVPALAHLRGRPCHREKRGAGCGVSLAGTTLPHKELS
jgi:hypothetical protein